MERHSLKGERKLYGQVVLSTLMYKMKFDDGTYTAYTANMIAENMWGSINNEGHHHDLLHLSWIINLVRI